MPAYETGGSRVVLAGPGCGDCVKLVNDLSSPPLRTPKRSSPREVVVVSVVGGLFHASSQTLGVSLVAVDDGRVTRGCAVSPVVPGFFPAVPCLTQLAGLHSHLPLSP